MVNHLYLVGEAVTLNRLPGSFLKTDDAFTVRAQLPPLGDVLQYRIKGSCEPYERVVVEHQITRLAAQPSAAMSRQSSDAVGEVIVEPSMSVSRIVRAEGRKGLGRIGRARS